VGFSNEGGDVHSLSNNQSIHSSRSAVIGIGHFGLQVVSLLLPRLELQYRYGSASATRSRPITRCGLIGVDTQSRTTPAIIERSGSAFNNVLHIQRLILQSQGKAPETIVRQLWDMLGEPVQRMATDNFHTWLDQLIGPIVSDEWDHTSSLVHLQVYLVVGDTPDDLNQAARVVADLVTFRVPLHLNLLVRDGQEQAFQQRFQQAFSGHSSRYRGHTVRTCIFGDYKLNRARLANPGESAVAACNYLEAALLSCLGDTVAERLLPDTPELPNHQYFGSCGAAKLYVPIAEIGSEIVHRFVAERLRRNVTGVNTHATPDLLDIIRPNLSLHLLWKNVLAGLPITTHSRYTWWKRLLGDLSLRLPFFRNTGWAQEYVVLRELPRLRIARQFWSRQLRSVRPAGAPERWWTALVAFEAQVLAARLDEWCGTIAERLGVGIPNTNAAIPPSAAPPSVYPRSVTRQSRSRRRGSGQRPGSKQRRKQGVISRRQSRQSKGRVRRHRSRNPRPIPQTTTQHASKPTGRGLIGETYSALCNVISIGLASDLSSLRSMAAQLKTADKRVDTLNKLLTMARGNLPGLRREETTRLRRQAVTASKRDLVDLLRRQPYPVALMARLAVFWILPLVLLVSSIDARSVFISALPEIAPDLLIWGWTGGMITIFLTIIGIVRGRIWHTKRRLEAIVLGNLDDLLERRIYGGPTVAAERAVTRDTPLSRTLLPIDEQPGILHFFLNRFREQISAERIDGTPESLRAVLDGAFLKLKAPDAAIPLRPESHVYYSIGDDLVRDVLGRLLQDRLETREVMPRFEAVAISEHLDTATQLNEYLRVRLAAQYEEETAALMDENRQLELARLLELPEHRDVVPLRVIDDLHLRSRPHVDITMVAPFFQDAYSTMQILCANQATMNSFLQPLSPPAARIVQRTHDPFGLGFVNILHGLAENPSSIPGNVGGQP
jgi:hypothetical protein